MPASCVMPNRWPLGSSSSISAVIGNCPAGPLALVRTVRNQAPPPNNWSSVDIPGAILLRTPRALDSGNVDVPQFLCAPAHRSLEGLMDAVETGTPTRAARAFLSYKRDVEPDQTLAAGNRAGPRAGRPRRVHRQATDGRPGVGARDREAGSRSRLPDCLSDRRVEPERDGARRDRDGAASRARPPGTRAFCRCA